MAKPETPVAPVPETENILTTAMTNADKTGADAALVDSITSAVAAIAETRTPLPIFTGHSTALRKLMDVHADTALNRIYEIDAQIATLLAERADAKASYDKATDAKPD